MQEHLADPCGPATAEAGKPKRLRRIGEAADQYAMPMRRISLAMIQAGPISR
jgi:hypothetical protein